MKKKWMTGCMALFVSCMFIACDDPKDEQPTNAPATRTTEAAGKQVDKHVDDQVDNNAKDDRFGGEKGDATNKDARFNEDGAEKKGETEKDKKADRFK